MNPEFRLWLKKEKELLFDDLLDEKQRHLFKKFVKAWNAGLLSERYYKGIENIGAKPIKRTDHEWKFAVDPKELRDAVQTVSHATNNPYKYTHVLPMHKEDPTHNDAASNIPDNIGRVIRPPKATAETEEELQEAIEKERERVKYEQRQHNRQHKEATDELVPKPDNPRESKIEKNKQVAAFAKAKDDDGLEEVDEYANDPNDFKSLLRKRQNFRDSRTKQRQEEFRHKMREHQKKEANTMAMLKQMAAARKWQTASNQQE